MYSEVFCAWVLVSLMSNNLAAAEEWLASMWLHRGSEAGRGSSSSSSETTGAGRGAGAGPASHARGLSGHGGAGSKGAAPHSSLAVSQQRQNLLNKYNYQTISATGDEAL
jgi:hypothetical protein